MEERLQTSEQRAASILRRALIEYAPSHVFLLFSGGNDSLSTTYFAASHLDRPFHVLHINTGIGIPETRDHVHYICALYGWPLVEIRAKEDCGQDYDELVTRFGFPGPPQHPMMYRRLKERCLEKLGRDYDGTLMLVSGARMQESTRRMRLTSTEVHKAGRRIWVSPFFYYSNDELIEYRDLQKIPESPVSQNLHMSGECLCGAFAEPGHLKEIEFFYPAVGQRLRQLGRRTAAAGFPWAWDERRPVWFDRMMCAKQSGQVDAFDQELTAEVAMLCSSCQFKAEKVA